MFYNFKKRKLISLNNIRFVYIHSTRPNTTDYWYIGIEYLDGKVIDLSVDNCEEAQTELQNIEKLLTNH